MEKKETLEVKNLREQYGLLDSRSEYTESELRELVTKEMYYIGCVHKNEYDLDSDYIIKHCLCKGYVSENGVIFVKSKELLKSNVYESLELTKQCDKVRENVWCNNFELSIYCMDTNELDFALGHMQVMARNAIDEEIAELEDKLNTLKGIKIKLEE